MLVRGIVFSLALFMLSASLSMAADPLPAANRGIPSQAKGGHGPRNSIASMRN
jgi:hypothetical protein